MVALNPYLFFALLTAILSDFYFTLYCCVNHSKVLSDVLSWKTAKIDGHIRFHDEEIFLTTFFSPTFSQDLSSRLGGLTSDQQKSQMLQKNNKLFEAHRMYAGMKQQQQPTEPPHPQQSSARQKIASDRNFSSPSMANDADFLAPILTVHDLSTLNQEENCLRGSRGPQSTKNYSGVLSK